MDASRPLADRHEICTQVWCGGQALKPTFDFYTTPKTLAGEKPQILPTRRQSEARNFVTAQHIDKQKIYNVSWGRIKSPNLPDKPRTV